MEVHQNNVEGLSDVETTSGSDELNEWERDRLLIELTIRINRIRKGIFSTYGKYLLPFVVAFPLCGILINIAFTHSKNQLPLGFLYLGLFLLITGIFLIFLFVILLVFDFFRLRYLNSLTGETLSQFECVHYGFLNTPNGSQPACKYFNRSFDEYPLCIICPMYKMKE